MKKSTSDWSKPRWNGAVETGWVLANLSSGCSEGLAAGRQKRKMFRPVDHVRVRMDLEIVAHYRAVPRVRRLSVVFGTPHQPLRGRKFRAPMIYRVH